MRTQGTAFRERIADAIALLAEPVGTLTPASLSATDYIAALREVEDLGRLVDAARITLAGEAEKRTQGPIDTLGALGYASAVDAVAMLTSAADRDAKRRIRVGESLNTGTSLTGAETGCAHPAIAESVFAGNLSIDVATILIDALDSVGSRVDDDVLLQAEEALVELAAGTPEHPPLRADLVRGQAQLFVEALDPDGVLPREEVARRKRRFTIGRETSDGLIPVNRLLTLEVGASLRRLVDAHVRKFSFSDDPDSMVEHVDDRFPHQKRHDTLADILSAAARVKDAPELAGSAPAITVTVTQAALDAGEGVGAIDGTDIPIPIQAIDRLIDSHSFANGSAGPPTGSSECQLFERMF